jgi:NADPH-dependent glutamate synthase beta chain and related oxidoreductases
MENGQPDITKVVNLTRRKGTGPVRVQRPVYVDSLTPCNTACPAGENIQAWLALAQAGRLKEAWERLVADNPFPSVHGRVCYHPCESNCNRRELDGAVRIHAVERFLGDQALRDGWKLSIAAQPSGKRVLIVGAGPAGLSAAYHLRRLGHEVEIHDAGPLPGGMLHFGIPAYRLPRADLIAEISRIEDLGVRIVLNHKVEDVLQEQAAGGFDAVFIAIGAHLAKHVEIPARDAVKVLDAVSLLSDVATGTHPVLGRRVVIYGGGNTAIDAARTVKRLGATETLIVYRRDQVHMTATEFETDEASAEGIKIKWLRSIKAINGGDLTVEVMKLDENGRPQPTGQLETLQADAVVLAVGQDADSGFLDKIAEIQREPDGTVVVTPNMMTGRQGIFAGGDMVASERTVTTAVGHGKKAARHIDAWLRATVYESPPKHPIVDFGMLNLPIFSDVLPSNQRELPIDERTTGFEEVVAGFNEPQALREAQRCFSCGNCFECDNCFAACPADAIIKSGPGLGYRIDFGSCTGCGTCVDQCPCHAMEIIEEPA